MNSFHVLSSFLRLTFPVSSQSYFSTNLGSVKISQLLRLSSGLRVDFESSLGSPWFLQLPHYLLNAVPHRVNTLSQKAKKQQSFIPAFLPIKLRLSIKEQKFIKQLWQVPNTAQAWSTCLSLF